MSILGPEEIELKIKRSQEHYPDIADTLAAYAEIVQELAEKPVRDTSGYCAYCGKWLNWELEGEHKPDCLWLRARKVRGME